MITYTWTIANCDFETATGTLRGLRKQIKEATTLSELDAILIEF